MRRYGRWLRWWRFALLLGLAGSCAAVSAAGSKLDVYVNPLKFDKRVARLAIGDPAPRLEVDRWMQGEPLDAFEPGTVYVVEFWATWCQPCRKSLPQMDALARRYAGRGVRVIGVAAAESDGPADLGKFLADARLSYAIAYRGRTDMYDTWVRAARGSGLPWVFVIDRSGRLAWWGQPFYDAFDGVVDAVVAGTWNEGREKAARGARSKDQRRQWKLRLEATQASEKKDWETARRDLDALVVADPERWWWEVVERVRVTAEGLGRPAEARSLADKAVLGVSKDNPHALTALAEALLDAKDPAGRDPDMALVAARRAKALTLGADADVLRVLARAEAAQTP